MPQDQKTASIRFPTSITTTPLEKPPGVPAHSVVVDPMYPGNFPATLASTAAVPPAPAKRIPAMLAPPAGVVPAPAKDPAPTKEIIGNFHFNSGGASAPAEKMPTMSALCIEKVFW